ncbi:hypothetical protein GF420_02830 [candidate division GN15 bacterium]|nr:hypothetical protein [candidate division GN15 bacterium]
MNRAAGWLLAIWIALVATEGMLRYLFVSSGLPFLIYAKDAILLAIIAWYGLYVATRWRIDTTLSLSGAVLVYGVLLAVWHGFSPAQVGFGLKIFLTFVAGYTVAMSPSIDGTALRRAFRIFVPLVALGLVLEMLTTVPWAGFAYEAFGQTVEGSRLWGMSGLPRLAGFGRASFSTANMLLCLAALYLADRVTRADRDRRAVRFFDALLLALCFSGIVVTTAKTALLALLALGLLMVLLTLQRHARGNLTLIWRGISQCCLTVFAFLVVVPPVLAVASPATVTGLLRTNNIIINILASSYVARMERMWPEAAGLLTLDHNLLTGRGVGGIGTAQRYFETAQYNAADNLFVYLVVTFGVVIAAAAIGFLLWKGLRLRAAHPGSAYLLVVVLIGLVCGATTNVVESAGLLMTAGVAMALWRRIDDTRKTENEPEFPTS